MSGDRQSVTMCSIWQHKDGHFYEVTKVEDDRADGRIVIWYRGADIYKSVTTREFCREISHFYDSFSFVASDFGSFEYRFANSSISHAEKSDTKPQGFTKADDGKPPLAILFDTSKALGEVARVMAYGAAKYDRKNWAKCDDPERYISATLRHIAAYQGGEKIDPESGMSHLAHAVCSLLFLEEMGV